MIRLNANWISIQTGQLNPSTIQSFYVILVFQVFDLHQLSLHSFHLFPKSDAATVVAAQGHTCLHLHGVRDTSMTPESPWLASTQSFWTGAWERHRGKAVGDGKKHLERRSFETSNLPYPTFKNIKLVKTI